ncbi:MAG: S41 family peptidase, partial [Planctomycetota bacterium]|nr:S41 family peptidase [Planctomycetota bacterium]
TKKTKKAKKAKEKVIVKIDFEDIHERIRRIAIPNSREGGLIWSPDSKTLAFTATVSGKRGLYKVSLPDDTRPKLLSSVLGSRAKWQKNNTISWLVNGVPSTLDGRTKASKSYPFRVPQRVDLVGRNRAAFDLCWRAMRDNFYDESLNNRNWSAIRRKYRDMAANAPDLNALKVVVSLMLGELNGSHLGFSVFGASKSSEQKWRESTAHFGTRFDFSHTGPGLKVRDVIPGSPASLVRSRVEAGELLLSANGQYLDSELDLSLALNGRLDRDMTLVIRGKKGERKVVIRPISYRSARSLLYKKWVKDNREAVRALSKDRLGYVHIRGMNWSSFLRFEEELYSAGAGKDGLVIDVRENGGGFTTDHLLTMLTQPDHAITVPRGGGQGYPHGRRVYATWKKPIIVLCNQNSFSNAEIFSHAIKTLGRGRVVGVPTAGGVISTGGRRIMDFGFLRMPFRGWYLLNSGEDMELHGAIPHKTIWPSPGDWPAKRDSQLKVAVKMLAEDVETWKKRRRPKLRKAADRRR